MMIGTDVHRRAVLKRVDVKIHKHIIKFAYPLRNSWLQTSHRWKERLSLNFFSIEKIQTLGLIHIARTKRIRYTRRTVVAQRWNPVEAKQKKKGFLRAVYEFLALLGRCTVLCGSLWRTAWKRVSVPSSRLHWKMGQTQYPQNVGKKLPIDAAQHLRIAKTLRTKKLVAYPCHSLDIF